MTKLNDLLESLTTVMVRYHDSQSGVKKLIVESDPILLSKKSRACAVTILQGKEAAFDTRLRDLIDECTEGYPHRKPFLNFLLHQIIFLKTLKDRNKSFEPDKLEEYKNQLSNFLIDLRVLLNTSKGKTYKVNYSNLQFDNTQNNLVPISLSGLINDYYPYNLCNSGFLLTNEVFETFNLTINHTDVEIKTLVNSICIEHQNALLVPEQQSEIAEEKKKNQALQQKVLELELQLSQQKAAAEESEKQYNENNSKLERTLTIVKEQEDTIGGLKVQINALSHPSPFIASAFQPAFFGVARYGLGRGNPSATAPTSSLSSNNN